MSMVKSAEKQERNAEESPHQIRRTQETTEMCSRYWEIIFAFCVLLTSFAAMQNSQLKVSKGPTPIPFFHQSSLIDDFFGGDLSAAVERGLYSDIACIMYYAPWDAESQALRSQFKLVAQYYQKEVHFFAINCWQPLSECKRQFSKLQNFPIIMAYFQEQKGIRYSGLKEASHIIRFLKNLIRPLERVENGYDILTLLRKYDAVVIGYIDFSEKDSENYYNVFYSTALRFLESDPYREVGFAVITNRQAEWGSKQVRSPMVKLVLWNGTLSYSDSEPFKTTSILKWISSSLHQSSAWVSPPGVKSLVLSSYVQDGSILMLFTPRNPLEETNHNYNLLREVSLDYFNCDGNPGMKVLSDYLASKRRESKSDYASLERQCLAIKEEQEKQKKREEVLSVQTSDKWWYNRSCGSNTLSSSLLCEYENQCSAETGSATYTHSKDFCHATLKKCTVQQNIPPIVGETEENEEFVYGPLQKDSKSRVTVDSLQISMLTGDRDERSAGELKNTSIREMCRQFRRAKYVHPPVFPRTFHQQKTDADIRGLACRANSSTLSFIAMDSLQFHQFAEGLGIPINTRKDKTATVIFNSNDEKAYVLDSGLSKESLIDFIVNYTKRDLKRFIRSSDDKPYHDTVNSYPVVTEKSCNNKNCVYIPELTAHTFFKIVMDPGKNVVVFYHSPFCTICQTVSVIYLTVMRYFKTVENLLFTRLDGEHNDLPWEYTMPRFPTIIFFPAARKSESRVYPQNIPVTVPNLINFILANMPVQDQLKLLVALCVVDEGTRDAVWSKECIRNARIKSIDMISEALAKYRAIQFRKTRFSNYSTTEFGEIVRVELHKQLKLLRLELQHLKEVNLLLGTVDEIVESSQVYKMLRTLL